MSEILDLIQSEVEVPQEVSVDTPTVATIETPAEPTIEPVQEVVTEQPQGRININDKLSELNSYLNKYPDRDITDYQRLKQKTEELDSNELIKKYLSDKEKMSDKAISLEMKKFENLVDDFDDDFSDLDEDERLRLEVDYETILGKAREWRDADVSEQLKDLEQYSRSERKSKAQLHRSYLC